MRSDEEPLAEKSDVGVGASENMSDGWAVKCFWSVTASSGEGEVMGGVVLRTFVHRMRGEVLFRLGKEKVSNDTSIIIRMRYSLAIVTSP